MARIGQKRLTPQLFLLPFQVLIYAEKPDMKEFEQNLDPVKELLFDEDAPTSEMVHHNQSSEKISINLNLYDMAFTKFFKLVNFDLMRPTYSLTMFYKYKKS